MKKLLLTSLFIMGATAFAGGNPSQGAQTPVIDQRGIQIIVNGVVEIPTKDDLIVEVKDHNYQNGSAMFFDLGHLIPGGKSKNMTPGSFIVSRAKGGNILRNSNDKLYIGLVSAESAKGSGVLNQLKNQLTVDKGTTSYNDKGSLVTDTSHVHIIYDLATNVSEKQIDGTVTVSAIVDSTSKAGRFDDSSVYMYVYAGK